MTIPLAQVRQGSREDRPATCTLSLNLGANSSTKESPDELVRALKSTASEQVLILNG